MSTVLHLAERLDLPAARPLLEALRSHAADPASCGPLTLDGSAVRHLGGLCLQVLLAAAQNWRDAGQQLLLVEASPALEEALGLFGLTAADLTFSGEAGSAPIAPEATL